MPSPGRVALAVLASLSLVLSLAACGGPSPAARAALARITAAGLLRDTEALGADSMAGRGPGTAGDRLARAYLARRLAEIGFEPGGPGGAWEQPITLIGLTVKGFDEWRFRGPAGQLALRWRADFIGGAGVQEPRVAVPAAEVVFVGYGIQAPEFEWDDFKGADLEGKILLVLNSDPDWDPALLRRARRGSTTVAGTTSTRRRRASGRPAPSSSTRRSRRATAGTSSTARGRGRSSSCRRRASRASGSRAGSPRRRRAGCARWAAGTSTR